MSIMVNAGLISLAPKIRCRRIEDADADNIVTLLTRGFATRRPRRFWERVIAVLATRSTPPGAPRYGYLLENDGAAVGAILLIFATAPGGDALRANVSSWYVEPAFRGYAPLLVSQARKLKQVTYLNISAAPHTWPILEAQGYRRYSSGVYVTMPALQRSNAGDMRLLAADQPSDAPHEPFERDLMMAHAGYGCISLWCETRERAHPFVFRPRIVKSIIPCAQLIYCRDVADVVRFAGPIGRFLALRGCPFVVIDANGPIEGLFGRYLDRTMPKFFRGPVEPRLGDLAYTETALFGM
jgi:hypothetical protein